MKKKLGISLREPVKIYNQEENKNTIKAPDLDGESKTKLESTIAGEKAIIGQIEREEKRSNTSPNFLSESEASRLNRNENSNTKRARAEEGGGSNQEFDQINFHPSLKFSGDFSSVTRNRIPDAIELMSERTFEIWKCLLNQAAGEGKLSRSFTVTRAQVMRQAKVGSTNTYRLALLKLQELGLLEIELRPGVTSGSVFRLTQKGIELAQTLIAKQSNS